MCSFIVCTEHSWLLCINVMFIPNGAATEIIVVGIAVVYHSDDVSQRMALVNVRVLAYL